MPRPYIHPRTLRDLRDSIAPGPPRTGDIGVAIARHERAETHTSAAIVDAIRRALPEGYEITWSMTGGGCSAWEVYRPADLGLDEPPYLLITGNADHTEASADLSHGAVIGLYAEGGCGEWTEGRETPGQPLPVARAVRELLDAMPPPAPQEAPR